MNSRKHKITRPFPLDWEEWFEERAAILEYDGWMSRYDAEVRAEELTVEMLRRRELGMDIMGKR